MSNNGGVVCADYETMIEPNYNAPWYWPIDFEWISVTALPLQFGGDVQLTVTSVSQTDENDINRRQINFTLVNNTKDYQPLFLTLTLPNFSVT